MPVRVGILTEKYAPETGGLAARSERVVSMLARAGHDVVVLAPSHKLPATEQTVEMRDRVTVIRLGVHRSASETMQDWSDAAVAAKKKFGLEVLHALHASWAAWAAVYAARWCGIGSVVSARGADLDSAVTDPERVPLVLWALEKAEAVTAPSLEVGKQVHTLVGDRAVYLAPQSVDAGVFRRLPDVHEMKEKLGLGGAKVVGFAGEAKKRKGLVTLLKALGRLRAEDPSVVLAVVGALKREDAALVEAWRKTNPAHAKAVVLAPWKPAGELARWYNAMDVLALPAVRTAGPSAAIEAMASETPAIVSDVPGLRGAVRHEQTGLVVPPRDDAALADAIRRLLGDSELRRKLATAGRAWALAEATPEKEREAFEHAYERSLGRGEQGKSVRWQVIPGQR